MFWLNFSLFCKFNYLIKALLLITASSKTVHKYSFTFAVHMDTFALITCCCLKTKQKLFGTVTLSVNYVFLEKKQ